MSIEQIKRRTFIAGLGSAAAWPMGAWAQQAERLRRIGILFGGFSEADPEPQTRIEAFRVQLQELGWTDDHNIKIDLRFGGGNKDRLMAYAQELIDLRPDVITANSAPAVFAVAQQTRAIPIVFANFFDPVGSGLVASLARPGGNITGFSNFEPVMTGKWLELLKEVAPGVTRAMAMFDRSDPSSAEFARTAETLAPSFNLQYAAAPVSNVADIQEAIDASALESNCGLIVIGGTVTSANREAIVQLTAQHRLPTVYAFRYYVTSGGLLSYGVDGVDLFRRAAKYVDLILRGAKPADLPVQTPTKFELAVNLRTAKALGLTIPPSLLATADEVIE
jgi:putative tryptophan/tyrosine transport system substrate-binding protein